MKANAVPLLGIFEAKLRLEVPLFQRQYVWSQEHQWEPLWEDITRKFTDHLQGRSDAPVHFLGAMVFDQKQTPTTHVDKRQVIDGQQRLTTLQLFLAAFGDFCDEHGYNDLASECRSFTLNKGMMADPDVDRFKVWPTTLDRPQFIDVLTAGSRTSLETKHPLVRRPRARRPDPRPRMVEAYLFFYDQLTAFFVGTEADPPIANEYPLDARLEESFNALRNSLQVVVIDLDRDDDPQVIFETLNARGEPLLPADLLRNFIFLRAARVGESQEELYNTYWSGFDDPFWRVEIRQGRLNRPRSDLFVQHFLASRLTADIPVKHLYVEYKYWIERKQPYATIRAELESLSRQREDYRRIIAPSTDDVLLGLSRFLSTFDVSTVYPLLLYFLDVRMPDSELRSVTTLLESYLLRRAVCGLTAKNYNRIFLQLTRHVQSEGTNPASVVQYLTSLVGESSEWPTDEEFGNAWRTYHVYHILNSARIIHILRRINDSYLSQMTEHVEVHSPLTVEHILPSAWVANWPLPDGSEGMQQWDLVYADADDERAQATRRRNALVHTLGNLTILTQPLNSSISNGPWGSKKAALQQHSLLPINLQLQSVDIWDESTIERRSIELLDRALAIWPRPD